MELIVTQGERQETVRLRQTPSGYEVELGDRFYAVDAKELEGGQQSLILQRLEASGEAPEPLARQTQVSVYSLGSGRYDVVDGSALPNRCQVADPLTHLAQESRGGSGSGGRSQVTAYMPGRVVALLVSEGDEVEEGQGVLVLEAMKMENEIPAESSGVIRRLLVECGQAVDSGDPLFEVE